MGTFIEWDGSSETELSVIEWDGSSETVIGDPEEVSPPPPGPEPESGTWPLMGVYMGAPNENPDDRYYTAVGSYPEIVSTYYQGYPSGGSTLNVSMENTRLSRGQIPLITFTTKNSNWTLAEIAAGDADTAWIDPLISQIAGLNAGEIWWTLDQEFEVKVNQGAYTSGPLAYQPTNQEYADAFNYVSDKIKTARPTLKNLYWYGYSDQTDINDIGSRLDMDLVDIIALDPYVFSHHSATTTFEEMAQPKLDWLRARSWFNNKPIVFAEYAKDKVHGDQYCADFYTNLRPRMKALGVMAGVFFCRDKPGDILANILEDASYPLAKAAYVNSVNEPEPV